MSHAGWTAHHRNPVGPGRAARVVSRDSTVYKETFNRCLDVIAGMDLDASLPPETELAERWNISRTTVRAVLSHLDERGIIDWDGRRKIVLREPARSDYFSAAETRRDADRVEPLFMRYVLGGDLAPGAILKESELSREFGVGVAAIREFLIRFSRFGLIEKKPNRHWVLKGFTKAYAIEVFDVRELFEMRAFDKVVSMSGRAEIEAGLVALGDSHRALAGRIDTDYLKFPELDEAFHAFFLGKLDNRFVDDFLQIVKIIFHFHYQWNKADERERNAAALEEHLVIIDALLAGDTETARADLAHHLAKARATLLASVGWEA